MDDKNNPEMDGSGNKQGSDSDESLRMREKDAETESASSSVESEELEQVQCFVSEKEFESAVKHLRRVPISELDLESDLEQGYVGGHVIAQCFGDLSQQGHVELVVSDHSQAKNVTCYISGPISEMFPALNFGYSLFLSRVKVKSMLSEFSQDHSQCVVAEGTRPRVWVIHKDVNKQHIAKWGQKRRKMRSRQSNKAKAGKGITTGPQATMSDDKAIDRGKERRQTTPRPTTHSTPPRADGADGSDGEQPRQSARKIQFPRKISQRQTTPRPTTHSTPPRADGSGRKHLRRSPRKISQRQTTPRPTTHSTPPRADGSGRKHPRQSPRKIGPQMQGESVDANVSTWEKEAHTSQTSMSPKQSSFPDLFDLPDSAFDEYNTQETDSAEDHDFVLLVPKSSSESGEESSEEDEEWKPKKVKVGDTGRQYMYTQIANLRPLEEKVNVLAVVKDFRPPAKSRGTDYYLTMTLVDESSPEEGVHCNIFNRQENRLPHVRSVGDVVCLHRMYVNEYGGVPQLVSRKYSSTVCFDGRVGAKIVPRTGSVSYTFTSEDCNRVKQLREWSLQRTKDNETTKQTTGSHAVQHTRCEQQEQQMGTEQQEQQMGTEQQEQQMGTEQEEQQMGTEQEEQQMGTEWEEQQMGTEREEQQMGTEQQEQQMGTEREEQQMGTEREDQQMGTEQQEQQMGTEREEQQMGTEWEEQQMGTEREEQQMETERTEQQTRREQEDQQIISEQKEQHLKGNQAWQHPREMPEYQQSETLQQHRGKSVCKLESVAPNICFDLVCQVVSISSCFTPSRTVLTVWDGTQILLKTPAINTSWCSTTPSPVVLLNSSGLLQNVVIYSKQCAAKVKNIVPGQYVYLQNIHAQPVTNLGVEVSGEPGPVVELCMKEAGTHFISDVVTLSKQDETVIKLEQELSSAKANHSSLSGLKILNSVSFAITTTLRSDIRFTSLQDVAASVIVPCKFRCRVKVIGISPLSVEDIVKLRCVKCGYLTPIPRNLELELTDGCKTNLPCTACAADATHQNISDIPWLHCTYLFIVKLEDESGSLVAYVSKEDALQFLSGIPPANFHKEQMQRYKLVHRLYGLTGGNYPFLTGSTEHPRPWIECCLLSYRCDPHNRKVYYHLFDTVLYACGQSA